MRMHALLPALLVVLLGCGGAPGSQPGAGTDAVARLEVANPSAFPCPDTLVSLTTGRKIMVLEELDEVIRLAVGYRSRARIYPVPAGGSGSVFEG